VIGHDRSEVPGFKMKCLVCKVELSHVFGDGDGPFQPYAGTAFSSGGHYGSTVFDPCDSTSLEVFICDGCLRELAHLCVHRTHGRREVIRYKFWDV